MQEPPITPGQYHVFPCPKCGKWAYAKHSIKVRKCGFCQTNIQIYRNAPIAIEKVSNAHRLVQEKNLNWQQQKGISISQPISVKVSKSQEPPFEGKIQDQKFRAIFRKIIDICTSRAMPLHALPIAYFAALYQSLEPSLSFGQFQRFCITQRWIHQNLSKNMISIKIRMDSL